MADEDDTETEDTGTNKRGLVRIRLRRGLNYTYKGKKYEAGEDYWVPPEVAKALESENTVMTDRDGERHEKPRFRVFWEIDSAEETSTPRAKRKITKPSRRSLRRTAA